MAATGRRADAGSGPARLIVGLLGPGAELFARATAAVAAEFGPVGERSADIPFDFTDYYEPELGPGLVRRWVAPGGAFDPGRLAEAKLAAGRIEQRLAVEGRRQVNVDPGVLSLHSLVLASTKNYAHRIYLRDGVYAELSLIYRSGRFEPLEWTYQDYRSAECLEFLGRARAGLTALARQG